MQQDLSTLTIEELLALAQSYGTANTPVPKEIQNASIEELFRLAEGIGNEPIQS